LRLTFVYVPAIATSTAGRVTLAFNYNALDPIPTNKQQVFSIEPNNEAAAWTPIELNVPCLNNVLYTRRYLQATGDLKTYDMGQLLVCTDLTTGAVTAGELYVDYTIELAKPHPQTSLNASLYTANGSKTGIFGTGYSNAIIGSGIITPPAGGAASTLFFNTSGTYFMYIHVTFASANDAALTITNSVFGTTSVVSPNSAYGAYGATSAFYAAIITVVVDANLQYGGVGVTCSQNAVYSNTNLFVSQLDASQAWKLT
jgi:hypothetical protein